MKNAHNIPFYLGVAKWQKSGKQMAQQREINGKTAGNKWQERWKQMAKERAIFSPWKMKNAVLQCVAVRCSVLLCVAVCCSVLQCVAACCRMHTIYTAKNTCTYYTHKKRKNAFKLHKFHIKNAHIVQYAKKKWKKQLRFEKSPPNPAAATLLGRILPDLFVLKFFVFLSAVVGILSSPIVDRNPPSPHPPT